MAGETRFEHATSGFGDRCSTVEPLPYANSIIILFSIKFVNKLKIIFKRIGQSKYRPIRN